MRTITLDAVRASGALKALTDLRDKLRDASEDEDALLEVAEAKARIVQVVIDKIYEVFPEVRQ